MAIADLYDANNVVVGQAAVFFAPENTALPDLALLNFDDPFSASPWVTWNLAKGSATSLTLTYKGDTTSSLTLSSLTAAALQTALEGLASIGVGNVAVTGATAGPWDITLFDSVLGGVLSKTDTGGVSVLTGPLWVPCGATDQGWTFGTNKSTQSINIEEQSTAVATTISSQTVTVEGALSEDISTTLALAVNGGITIVDVTSDEPGYEEINPTDDVIYYAVALVAATFDGKPRVIYAPKYSQLSNVSTAYRRASAKRMYPVSFVTACKPSQIRIINLTAAATG